jgi:hypothetical protein
MWRSALGTFDFDNHQQSSTMLPSKRKAAEVVPPGGIAPVKRKAPKNTTQEAGSSRPTDLIRDDPTYVHPINEQNKLHILPFEIKLQFGRPWYFYDIVEPTPKFRPTPKKYKRKKNKPAEISEGEDSDELSDHPGPNKLPVSWSAYRQVSHLCHLIPLSHRVIITGENTSWWFHGLRTS